MAIKAESLYSNNVSQSVFICSDNPRESRQIQSDKDILEYCSWWSMCLDFMTHPVR